MSMLSGVIARLDRLGSLLNRLVEYLLATLGLSMALIIAVQVFCRYVLNQSLFWSEELARYMLVYLSFLGATAAYHRGLHPGVDLLTARLSGSMASKLRLLGHLVALFFFIILIISGTRFAWFVRLQISPALGIPKWFILAIIPASGLIFFLYGLIFLLRELEELRR
ncbi:TRAP transporter small permease [Desulfolithobacter sp.]